jgi:CcmD family protein
MSSAEKYVAAAYLVVFVGVLAWVAIIGSKLARLAREVEDLAELARRRAEREREAARRDRVGV